MNYIFAIGCYILKITREQIFFAVKRVQNMTDETKRDDKTVMRQKRRTGDINSESCVPEAAPCRAQSYEYKHKYKYKYMCKYRYEKIHIQIQKPMHQKRRTRTSDIKFESCVAEAAPCRAQSYDALTGVHPA